jgi:hypothetical protein
MKTAICVLCSNNWTNPEIEISASPQGLIELGELLININKDLVILSTTQKSAFYPEAIQSLVMKFSTSSAVTRLDVLNVSIVDKSLVFEGSSEAFRKLGDSLLNYFDENSQSGEHFHLDYVEGDDILAPTNCSLIFVCKNIASAQ